MPCYTIPIMKCPTTLLLLAALALSACGVQMANPTLPSMSSMATMMSVSPPPPPPLAPEAAPEITEMAVIPAAMPATIPATIPAVMPTPQNKRRNALDTSNALAMGDYRMSMNFVAAGLVASDFRLGNEKDEWDEGQRIELDFIFHFPADEYVEPMGGGYIFYESREYDDGPKHIDYDALGFGIEFGALFTPMKQPDKAPVVVGIMPYTRIGAAYQDGVFRNIQTDEGTITGDISDWRGSIGLGVDLRASFFQRLLAGVGIGFEYWGSARPNGTTRDSNGIVIDDDDRQRFRGTDWWVRASIGFKF